MCLDNEEWCKNWRGFDLLFQNWHEELDEFWLEHLKVSKVLSLIVYFWPKYIMFELKSTEELSFTGLKSDRKFEGELTWGLGNDMRNVANIHQIEHSKSSKLGLWWDSFMQSRKCLSLKFTEELCIMTVKNDIKRLVVSKLTWEIWQTLTQAHKSLKNLHFNELLLTKVYNVWATKVQIKSDLCFQKSHEEFGKVSQAEK